LLKSGHIGRLEAINLSVHPETAQVFGVRSVPWVRIGPYELEGLRTQGELQRWAERAATDGGMAAYLEELLKGGDLGKVLDLIAKDPGHLDALLALLGNSQTELHARVGIGAVIETLQGSDALKQRVPALIALTRHPEARVRGDACHYLALSQSPQALEAIRGLLSDPDPQVQDIARDSMAAVLSAS
jgi:hypothetical protein